MARYLWTQREDIGPSPRMGHAMAYDAARSRTILFGGDPLGTALLSDTWEWDGEFWTQVADIGPGPRRDHGLCFDSSRNMTLLFGGIEGRAPLGDTWGWNGEDWTQLEETGPSPRSGYAMAFDATRGRAVLFGGESATGLLNDTWEWDGDAWTQQEDTGPSARKNHVLAFDLVHNRVILFGGASGSGAALGDTWSWDGSAWTQISDFGASPCLRAAMVSTDVQVSMYGGLDSPGGPPAPTVFHETWVFDGKHWTHRQDIGPGPRWGHALAYDASRRTIVLFGGLPIFGPPGDGALPARLLGDTWEHKEADGTPIPPPNPRPTTEPGWYLALSPTSASPGNTVEATITIASTDSTTPTQLVWMRESVFNATVGSGQQVRGEDLTLLENFTMPPNSTTYAVNFVVPAVNETIVVGATSNTGAWVTATLRIL